MPIKTFRLLGLALALAACRREEVTHFRVPKVPAQTTLASTAPSGATGSPGMGGDVAAPPQPGSALSWTLPKGWSEERGGPMRFATFKVPAAGKLDGSVVVLPGPAGGELANVNRWRGQIGLGPIDEPALAAARKTLASKAGPMKLYDFASDGDAKRMVVALAEVDGSTWFLKLTGDAPAVAAARPDFLRLLESVRRADSH